ncbi:MAG TPA: efflux RND transporter permease subunit [Bacteroidales bacterium]|nr:efflux RND transporter permease subunit [Bacteroidales bacterium]HPI69201.1 efflux RND transporter permease subunit [Bacteroidales bacterium]HPR73849.1 efflux RND transporter permease subunit [Bacteroidales bacterium]
MSIYSSSVNRPVTTILVFIGAMVIGLYSLTRLPVDLYPEMELPFIAVYSMYPGASASDIESNVTRPLEDAVNSVTNLKEMTSSTSDGIAVLLLNFEYGTNLDEASNDVRSSLSFIENYLPEGCEKPTIMKFNSSMMPIVYYSITADESYQGLEKILDEKIVNPLNRIEGVGAVSLAGVPGRKVYIDVDPRKMEAYNLTIEQIGNILRAENMNLPAGYLEMGKTDYPLRIQGEFPESDVLKDIVVTSVNGQSIFLKDVAEVRDTIRETKLDTRLNGAKGMSMYIQKQSGGNTVKVTKEVEEALAELAKDLPPDVQIQKLFDSATFIKDSISNLTETLMYAGIFVILVVLFFLGRWRATLIVIVTIPISLLVAFIYLFITGESINIISLTSLSIAIGMVVDDAIVVLENITKHVERGSRPREAAIYATNEVWLTVLVATLTVVAVFFPLTFVTGLTGVLFKQLGMIVTITIITSVIAAITLTPTMSALLLKWYPIKENASFWTYDGSIRKALDWLDGIYEKLLRWALHHKRLVVISAFIIFLGSMLLLKFIDTEFFPEADESRITATVELQTGTRVEETVRVADRITSLLQEKYPEITLISSSAGADEEGGFASLFGGGGTHSISYNIRLLPVEERTKTMWDLTEEIRGDLAGIPEVVDFTLNSSGGFALGSTTVDVEVYGYNISETNIVAEQLAEKMRSIEGARDVTISRDKSKPELQIIFDQNKMMANGLNTATVATAVRNRVDGMTATQLRQFGDEYDVVVRFKKDAVATLTDIENIGITNPLGQVIRLGEIAEVKETMSPPSIERKRRERVVTVSFTPYKKSLTKLQAEVEQAISDTDIPSGVMLQVGGAIEDQTESFMDIAFLIVVSLILVYLVMASQFESLRIPFIIMFSIPFAFSGVAIALFLTNTTLSIISAIGAVMLIGIVVKNAIVLVDFINLMRDRDHEVYEAIEISGKSRLRPVLMTSATTILGMLPLALSTGSGSELWSPMGISVIGGLIFSTLVTLVLVPVVYAIFSKHGERAKKLALYSEMDFFNGNGNDDQ